MSISLFVLAFGFTSLMETQVITMERWVAVCVFLILVSGSLLYFFRETLLNYVRRVGVSKRSACAWFGLALLVHAVTSYVVITFLPQPNWPFSSHGTSFLLMNDYYIFVKPLDIFMQQLLVLLLVLRLDALGMSLKKIITLFVFGFGVIHIFQIFKTDLYTGLAFTAGAVVFSFVFPRLILKTKNGFSFNYIIHLFAYNLAAVLAYTLY